MKRRSRDQKRSDLDFLIRNATIRDRIRSIDAEHLAKGTRRSWSRIQFEKPNQKIESRTDKAKIGDLKDTGRLPPIAEGGSTGARSHPGSAEEKDVVKAYSEEVVTETTPTDQGVIIEWLDSCLADVSFPKDEESTFSFTATEESFGQTSAPKPNACRKRSQLASNPTSYSALLIKHRENLMAMKTEALNERPKVYVWNGDWLNRSGNQTNQRCPPGRVGARSEFLLKEISLPKPALTRYPPPTSKDFYRRKKALVEEFTNLRQLSQAMKDLFRKLEVLKDEDGSLAVFKLLMKLSAFIQEKPSGSDEQPPRKVDEDEELNSKSGGEVSADPRC
ncbi:hypothetical protein FGIG_06294 [Fasciola gigantica]|uniref:Uncharacterized protein n=1 Tax=Fasciola gigantica TaxID=46835 RepID=A0A504YYR6_FASGI|nr:hypothetical protein FGIG_06294 [Fasciola gigantica]